MSATGSQPAAIPARWELFPHDADIGVRGEGPTLESAFEQAALALTAAVTDPRDVRPQIEVRLTCEAPDRELLLVEWLNAVVFEMATRHMLFGRYSVSIEGARLVGRAWGEPLDVARHQPAVEVKGATYTALRVTDGPEGRWIAQCVIDV
ncbi:MAG: archease [Rhodospirillaceae bacterium]|nr:archease [Rhodospirillaceae bacterium]